MVQDVLIEFEPIPGQKRKIRTYSDKMVLAENSIKKGIELKMHSHPSSQVLTYVVEGRLLINVNGKEDIFVKGDRFEHRYDCSHSAIVCRWSYSWKPTSTSIRLARGLARRLGLAPTLEVSNSLQKYELKVHSTIFLSRFHRLVERCSQYGH